MHRSEVEVTCRPVILDAVCSTGTKCFHNTHYLYCAIDEMPIPADACIINCRINQLNVENVRRTNGCILIEGTYRIRVWFEFGPSVSRDVTFAQKDVCFKLQVPVEDIEGGCVLCNGQEPEICWVNTKLHCLEACLEENPDPYDGGDFRIRVVVEKEFFVMEEGRSIICLPVCPPNQCPTIPPPVAGEECPACFTEQPQCKHWCQEDEEENPGNCNQCPPPQVRA